MAQIDSSIYSQQRPVDIMGAAEKGMNLRQMVDQRNQQAQEREAMKGLYSTDETGRVSLNTQSLGALAKINPQKAMELQESADAKAAAKKKSSFEEQIRNVNLTGQLLGSVSDQTTWDNALGEATRLGIPGVDQMPKQYDPTFVKHIQARALTAKEQLDQQAKQQDFGLKEREFGLKKEEVGIKRQEAKAKLEELKFKTKGDTAKMASELRKERSGLPTTRATQEVSASYNKIQQAAQNPSPAGDLSLIFGYMKMLDPGSTVREGEFANAQNAAGIPDQVRNAYNRAMSGQRLNPEQRNDFVGQADKIYNSQISLQKQIDGTYAQLAQDAGVDPSKVLVNFAANTPSHKPKTVIQNGVQYTLNEETGEYE